MARAEVLGVDTLQHVFRQLTPQLQKKYTGRLVTSVAGKVRTDSRKLAPSGKRTGTTALKSAKERGEHRPLRKNIKTGKLRRKKNEAKRSVYGPPQANPLLSGHKLVAWRRPTNIRVSPSIPFLDLARAKHEHTMDREGAEMMRKFIATDVKRLGKIQAQKPLKKVERNRLAALREVT